MKAQPAPSTQQQTQLKGEIALLSAEIAKDSTQINGLQSVIAGIDGFVASLAGAPAASPPAPTAAAAVNPPATSNVPPAPAANPTPSAPAPTSSIVAILNADGLARALGVQPDGTWKSNSTWRVLALKALESGGALITESNVLGEKVHFSGGAAATYSLFELETGALDCSGNLVAYGGYVEAKDFVKQSNEGFSEFAITPSKQLLFERGGCASLNVSSHANQ